MGFNTGFITAGFNYTVFNKGLITAFWSSQTSTISASNPVFGELGKKALGEHPGQGKMGRSRSQHLLQGNGSRARLPAARGQSRTRSRRLLLPQQGRTPAQTLEFRLQSIWLPLVFPCSRQEQAGGTKSGWWHLLVSPCPARGAAAESQSDPKRTNSAPLGMQGSSRCSQSATGNREQEHTPPAPSGMSCGRNPVEKSHFSCSIPIQRCHLYIPHSAAPALLPHRGRNFRSMKLFQLYKHNRTLFFQYFLSRGVFFSFGILGGRC